jgi:predicted DNA-binding transcriptional regulator AlpA
MSVFASEPVAEQIDGRDVSVMAGCSSRHFRRLVDSGDAPQSRRLGRLVRWSRREIMAWIDAGCPSPRKTGWRFTPATDGGSK